MAYYGKGSKTLIQPITGGQSVGFLAIGCHLINGRGNCRTCFPVHLRVILHVFEHHIQPLEHILWNKSINMSVSIQCVHKKHSTATVRAKFFSERIVSVWNNLLDNVDFSTLASFTRTIKLYIFEVSQVISNHYSFCVFVCFCVLSFLIAPFMLT